jgi:hypothetical protein
MTSEPAKTGAEPPATPLEKGLTGSGEFVERSSQMLVTGPLPSSPAGTISGSPQAFLVDGPAPSAPAATPPPSDGGSPPANS